MNSCRTLEKEGFRVTYLNVDKTGKIDINQLLESICDETILISIMFANNEIGTIEPIAQIGEIAHKNNILFHTDSVQAIGNVRIDVKDMNIDLLSMSGHKFYAPKGVGALYVKDGVNFNRIQDGGHQEKNKRAGTENVAEIVGLGKAIDIIYKEFDEYNLNLRTLRDYYIKQIEENIPNAILNGDRENRLAGNANFSFKGIDAGQLILKLDESGICASAGSACSTGEALPSHVLTAIGLDSNLAKSALRVSFGRENTLEDVDFLVNKIKEFIKK